MQVFEIIGRPKDIIFCVKCKTLIDPVHKCKSKKKKPSIRPIDKNTLIIYLRSEYFCLHNFRKTSVNCSKCSKKSIEDK